MNTLDLTPLYRSTVGFDRFGALLNAALGAEKSVSTGYPPYSIEVVADDRYAITIAVAGFEQSELDIQVENGTLNVRGKQQSSTGDRKFLHQGIANRAFERKFALADHVEVDNAELHNGLLTLHLVRDVPESMKPRKIAINGCDNVLDHEAVKTA